MLTVIFLFCLLELTTCTDYCNLCSDANIETHYGGFFVSPRDIQDSFRQNVSKCDRTDVPYQECGGYCFSLNVTSLHIKSRQLMPFGVSYGCAPQILPMDVDVDNVGCTRKDVLLRTVPPYVVQAEYCICKGSGCNDVIVVPPAKQQKNITPWQNFYSNLANTSDSRHLCLLFLLFFVISVHASVI